jgi:hypothetical protein
VERIHINGSVVTVTVGGGHRGDGLADVVRDLFLHYNDTPEAAMAPPTDEADATPEALADPAEAPAAVAAADAAPDAVAADGPVEQSIEGIPEDEVTGSSEA